MLAHAKKTSIQHLIGIGFAFLTIPVIEGTLSILPDIGWTALSL